MHPCPPSDPAKRALDLALELGFDLAGLAPLRAPGDGERFRQWLAAGHHAGMAWLERNADRILDPARVLHGESGGPGCILVVGLGHYRKAIELPGGGRIARYAAGRDYHNRMGKLLKKLAKRLEAAGLAGRWRGIVDAGPILERSHAQEAGLGFPSKAANLLNPDLGPWFFLGELLLDVDLTVHQDIAPNPPPGSCGTCTACLDACPTQAIRAPGVVDANLCISYHTIENRGEIPRQLRPLIGPWVFGCDICSEVCPWGTGTADRSSDWGTHPEVAEGSLLGWLLQDQAGFGKRFEGSPLSRPKRMGLARNSAIVLGNLPQEGGAEALGKALGDEAPEVREAAAWALAEAHGQDRGVRAALERAHAREPDPKARLGIERSLGDE